MLPLPMLHWALWEEEGNISLNFPKNIFTFRQPYLLIHRLSTNKQCPALTVSWRRSVSNWNQSTDLLCKSMGWFQYDRDLRHRRLKGVFLPLNITLRWIRTGNKTDARKILTMSFSNSNCRWRILHIFVDTGSFWNLPLVFLSFNII